MFASVSVIVFVGEIENAMELIVLLPQITNIYLSSLATIYLQLQIQAQKRLQAQFSLHSQLKANNFFRYVSAIVLFESINCIIIKNIGYFVLLFPEWGESKTKKLFFFAMQAFLCIHAKKSNHPVNTDILYLLQQKDLNKWKG